MFMVIGLEAVTWLYGSVKLAEVEERLNIFCKKKIVDSLLRGLICWSTSSSISH